MKRALLVVSALVAAFAVVGSSSAGSNDASGSGLSPQALGPRLGAVLDPNLSELARSVRTGGIEAALATARSNGLLVSHGKVRVLMRARAGHVAGARAAIRLAHGTILVTTGRLIETLVPPRALRQLAASRHVADIRPVRPTGVAPTMGLRTGLAPAASLALGGLADAGPVELSFTTTTPGAPTDAFAEAGDGQAFISFTPPASDGGSEIIYYTATAYPGGQTASSTGWPIIVGGLTNGVAYKFTVTATTTVGTGPESNLTELVTPDGPTRLDADDPPSARPRPVVPGYTGNGGRLNPHQNTPEF